MGRAFEYRKAAKMKRWGHMSRVFPKLGKIITIAAKEGGPDPDMNPKLRQAILNAKAENMPKDNIDAAIKRATDKSTADMVEIVYEGKGPHGVLCVVECATDNTTRTVADVRSIFNKFSGTLGTMGSLAYLFDHYAMFSFKKPADLDTDEMILELIDLGVNDEFDEEYDEDKDETIITIYGDPKSFALIQKYLEEHNYEITTAEFTYVPNDLKEVTDEQRETIEKMVERLEEFDDVQNVYTNMK